MAAKSLTTRTLLCLASVVVVLFARGPSAVAGLIVPVVVDPVDSVSGSRSLAHVRKEVGEGCFPAFTYADASSAVVLEAGLFGVSASREHPGPDFVLRQLAEQVLCIAGHQDFSLIAAAALAHAGQEDTLEHPRLTSTRAAAIPNRLLGFPRLACSHQPRTDDGPSVECLASDVRYSLSHAQIMAFSVAIARRM
jgi:hypothetical protein